MSLPIETELLRLVCEHNVPEHLQARQLLPKAIEMLARTCNEDEESISRALVDVVLRALETRLLADQQFINLARYWNSYVGKSEELIASRVKELVGFDAPQELVQFLRNCLRARSVPFEGKATIARSEVVAVLEAERDRHPETPELRCAVCGYHFQRSDVGEERGEIIQELGLRLAEVLHPSRTADPFKPTRSSVKPNARSLLELTIDHMVPEAGFGWAEVDNLRVVCQFCNAGKGFYRRPLEPISPAIAASLHLVFNAAQSGQLRQITVVAAIASKQSRCENCRIGQAQAELTVRPRPEDVSQRDWFVPWNLQVLCYTCCPA